MDEKLKVKVIVGSTRPSRFGDKPAAWIAGLAGQKGNMEVEILDLRDYPLPFYNEPVSASQLKGNYTNDVAPRWASKIAEADAYIIVSPEYNHGYPAVLKNALDHAYYEWNKKPVAFVAYGSVGGARSVEQLRQVAVELQMAPLRNAVHIPEPWTLTEGDALKPGALDSFVHAAETLLVDLFWWGKALKAARAQV